MIMRIVDYNKTLTDALKYSKDIYNEISSEDFDDEELLQFLKINNLNQLEKDILFLYSLTNNITELSRLYKVSTFFIRKLLDKINLKLQ